MMDRRRFLLTSLAGALAGPLAAGAQPVGKVWRVGLLASGLLLWPASMRSSMGSANSATWKDENLAIEYRWAEGRQKGSTFSTRGGLGAAQG